MLKAARDDVSIVPGDLQLQVKVKLTRMKKSMVLYIRVSLPNLCLEQFVVAERHGRDVNLTFLTINNPSLFR